MSSCKRSIRVNQRGPEALSFITHPHKRPPRVRLPPKRLQQLFLIFLSYQRPRLDHPFRQIEHVPHLSIPRLHSHAQSPQGRQWRHDGLRTDPEGYDVVGELEEVENRFSSEAAVGELGDRRDLVDCELGEGEVEFKRHCDLQLGDGDRHGGV